MNTFQLRNEIIENGYKTFIRSFGRISNRTVSEAVKTALDHESDISNSLPEPLVQFNPFYAEGKSISELIKEGMSPELGLLFPRFVFHKHQTDATQLAQAGKGFIVTSGTGSGKSLTYLLSILDYCIKERKKGNTGVKAILVYPMNALLNSQELEIDKFLVNFLKSSYSAAVQEKYPELFYSSAEYEAFLKSNPKYSSPKAGKIADEIKVQLPVIHRAYSGQEQNNRHEALEADIILTNYMMLELIMTRSGNEKALRDGFEDSLKYLVFDELHTYRGRQGADVALLIRRIKRFITKPLDLIMIGTSATMASGNTSAERKKAISNFASKIFNQEFSSEQIVEETLRLQTVLSNNGSVAESLADPYQIIDFSRDTLACKIEREISTENENGLLKRGTPLSVSDMAQKLDVDREQLETYLAALERANKLLSPEEQKYKKVLPFKLHQFIKQTGSVKATLGEFTRESVYVTEEYYSPNEVENKLYELVFSRVTGKAFFCVSKGKDTLHPRRFSDLDALNPDEEEDAIGPRGYVILDSELRDGIPTGFNPEDYWSIENLPDQWIKTYKTKPSQIDPVKASRLPQAIWIHANGRYKTSYTEGYTKAWYMPEKLLLDPTCGVIFIQQKENTKLGRLGTEGRSTATTILSLYSLLKQAKLEPNGPRKMLSFTDNRQDASLQAGHFEDFVSSARLRIAMYQAVKESGKAGLTQLSQLIYNKLGYSVNDLVKDTSIGSPLGAAKQKIVDLYTKLIQYRLLLELRDSWRYIHPNLEQVGLLKIEYENLIENLTGEDAAYWNEVTLLKNLSIEEREEVITQVLNYLRKGKAVAYPAGMYGSGGKDLLNGLFQDLRHEINPENPLMPGSGEQPETACVALTLNLHNKNYVRLPIGKSSVLGSYLYEYAKDQISHKNELDALITELLDVLTRFGYLESHVYEGTITKKGISEKVTLRGYQIKATSLNWVAGNGTPQDLIPDYVRIKIPSGERKQFIESQRINEFFLQLFKEDLFNLSETEGKLRLEAKEHTGQISNSDRKKREEDFKSPNGKIGVLYCSPTMELGIDISDLALVHMRGVPPLPSNYAQRSGRAGRSGQNALVITYCSSSSPHDMHYFKDQKKIVMGAVTAPNLDLTNMELIKSHFHAYVLMQAGLELPDSKGEDSSQYSYGANSVASIVELDKALELKSSIRSHLTEAVLNYGHSWKDDFCMLLGIHDLAPDLQQTIREVIAECSDRFVTNFDKALDRWRNLYRSTYTEHERKSDDNRKNQDTGSESVSVKQLENMLRVLKGQSSTKDDTNSEYNFYRYMASEGFLPGYNFPKQPVRAVMFKSRDMVDTISRPRMIALKEFGPFNFIYHNGSKYHVSSLFNLTTLNEGTNAVIAADLKTGYASLHNRGGFNKINGKPLNSITYNSLVSLDDVRTRAREKISSMEEERMRHGYIIKRYFEFSDGGKRVITANFGGRENPLIRIWFDAAATIIAINQGLRASAGDGDKYFKLNIKDGNWLSEPRKNAPPSPVTYNPENSDHKKVHLFTTVTNDILYLEPMDALGLSGDGKKSLANALKLAIKNVFSIENNEIDFDIIGEDNNILLYENTEGSLGVLRQLVGDNLKFKTVLEKALEICHFRQVVNQDGNLVYEDARPDLPKASYEDLLSYYNQRDHDVLDRQHVLKSVSALLNLDLEVDRADREALYHKLLAKYDRNSELEGRFLDYLYHNNLRLPDDAQVYLPALATKPDFIYNLEGADVLVYIDGSVHDDPMRAAEDARIRQNCINAGYMVLVYRYDDDLAKFVQNHTEIFVL